MTRPARTVRVVAALAAAGAALAAAVVGWGHPAPWAPPVLAVAVAASELAVVHLAFGRQRWTFSCTEGALGAAFVFAPGGWVPLAVAVGVAAAQLARRQPRLKAEFNVAQFTAGAALGAVADAVWIAAGGSRFTAAIAALAAFWLVNHCLVAVAVAVTSRRGIWSLLVTSAPLSAIHSSGNSSVGLLAAWLVLHAPAGLLGLLVPMALLWSSYDQQTRRGAEARLFAELARGQERASGRSVDVSAQVVLTAAARLFGGADVEMVLLAADGPVHYAGDEFGVPERRRVDPDAFDRPWVLRALGHGGVSTGVEDSRPYCAAVLGPPDAPLAVLAARRVAGSAAFGRREVMLAEVLVGQAESWLSVADLTASRDAARSRADTADHTARSLGDLGAHTAPALGVLRESTARLARLAELPGGSDSVDDIVNELHAVERAVASLLGAIALAAERDLAADAVTNPPSGPARITTDWTTTGVLTSGADVVLEPALAVLPHPRGERPALEPWSA